MRYYGCKTKLLGFIEDAVKSLNIDSNESTFFDAFSGTSVVGQHFKKLGYKVYANDFLELAYAISSCYIGLNKEPKFIKLNKLLKVDPIDFLNNIESKVGFITKNYSPYESNSRMFFSVDNAKKIDTIRTQIEEWKNSKLINNKEFYYLITSLLDSINLVSNVPGTYAAFLKTWDNRATKKLILSRPNLINNNKINIVYREDINILAPKINADIVYLDPPYNSRQYASNYFMLELIAEGWFKNEPEIYGVIGMRPYNHQKSDFSKKLTAENSLKDLILKLDVKYILLSYNNEGIVSHKQIEEILRQKGELKIFRKEHKRYRSINQDGSNVKVDEILYLVKSK